MTRRTAFVHRMPAAAPDDVVPLASALGNGSIPAEGIVAILGKTEGNGCVNDFTRAFAVRALKDALRDDLSKEAVEKVSYVMSGGTEGGLAPHWLVLGRAEAGEGGQSPSLAIGGAHTPAMPSEDLGRRGQVALVAAGVRAAMADAGIDDPADVHFVQIKCPLLTADRIAAVDAAGKTTSTRDTLKSMGMSRGASALGAAVALGELSLDDIEDSAIGRDVSLWCGRASTSAGVELLNHEIVVMGMSADWVGPLAIDHAVMADGIDVEPVRAALKRLGFAANGQLSLAEQPGMVALLAKAEAGSTGRLRGKRHTMLDDSDISSTRHARGFVAGALAGLVGHAEIFVSGGAEHQGPDGGGPVAIIANSDWIRGGLPS
ncbi:ring-opening amidohydrolase [Kaistia dalseonensis]|uniref:Cyanuric acid amidohydrolase n=1 Tax=Kaistia dalseonensis TaxID=410840 RepID=A0ABU0H9B7_9HYPH|nr:ring-opening amidohydrolase [Kaistia dalseonensis]MCX5496291.1 ring-opening amidohydrolase [Kaistia dalseonensis]MDQ0438909.1 cyanuric acid amidohydrolase [Kaistia dalseonensis]